MGNPSKLGFKLCAHSLLSICAAYCNQGDWELREWPVPLIRSFSSSLLAHRIVLGLIKRLEPRRPLQGETIPHPALTSQLASADRKRGTAQKSVQLESSALLQAPNFHPNCRNYQAASRPRHSAKEGSWCLLGWGFGGAAPTGSAQGSPELFPENTETEITGKIPGDAALWPLWPPVRCCSFHPSHEYIPADLRACSWGGKPLFKH